MKRGDWVFNGVDQIGKIKNEPYAFSGVLHIDVTLYARDGERIGRASPAMGGPRGFEPACTADQWTVIERPEFPLSRFRYLAETVVSKNAAGPDHEGRSLA